MKPTLFETMLRSLYPPCCLLCAAPVDRDFGLCPPCWRDMPFISQPACMFLGMPIAADKLEGPTPCDSCFRAPPAWEAGRAALLYQRSAKGLILAMKHGDRTDCFKPAASWLFVAYQDLLTPDTIVTAVPLHWRRYLNRKYNQAAFLGQHVARLANISYEPFLLKRHRATAPLDTASSAERRARMQNTVALNPARAQALYNKPVLIIDDVMTSGATLTAAAQACRAGQPQKISVAILARTPKNDY
jgi:predicted amidophosphoribosyltransferase